MAEQLRRLLRLPDVIQLTGYKRSAILEKVKKGEFPAPISLGARAVAWTSDSISDWIDSRIKAAGVAK